MGCGASSDTQNAVPVAEATSSRDVPTVRTAGTRNMTSGDPVEAMLKFMKGPEFSAYVESFVEKECVIFDDEEENFAEYLKVHKQYKDMVDDLITAKLHELGLAEDDFMKVINTLNGPDTTYVVNTILSTDDYELFKTLMVKRNVELTRQVLEVLEASKASVTSKQASLTSKASVTSKAGSNNRESSTTTGRQLLARESSIGQSQASRSSGRQLLPPLPRENEQVLDVLEASRPPRPMGSERKPSIALMPAESNHFESSNGIGFANMPEPDEAPAPVLVAALSKDADEMTEEEELISKVPQQQIVLAETFRGKAIELEAKLAVAKEQYEEALRAAQLRADAVIQEYQDRWKREFEQRRQLHNQVMELKGNIRVLCRIRPMISLEYGSQSVNALDAETVKVVTEKGDFDYTFNRVFSPSSDQQSVFEEVVGLVVSCLDGYNVCIMAYGQTGSGKTYTMEGPEDNPGVNTRTMQHLFQMAADKSDAFQFDFQASVVEIYNEAIYDMLQPGGRANNDGLEVKEGAEGIYLAGLQPAPVNNMSQLLAVLNKARSNRSTASTAMNERSSRSHLVTTIYVTSYNKVSGQELKGKLHLIDLAGSERLSRTGAEGDRLKEAQAINSSLSALGDVIQALQQHQPHIPYRNSKLTRLLQDSLGGHSKCVLVVNCSPATVNASETKNALEFATRAQKVELGKAVKHVAKKR